MSNIICMRTWLMKNRPGYSMINHRRHSQTNPITEIDVATALKYRDAAAQVLAEINSASISATELREYKEIFGDNEKDK